jgi:hypothetical protein
MNDKDMLENIKKNNPALWRRLMAPGDGLFASKKAKVVPTSPETPQSEEDKKEELNEKNAV